MAKSQYFKVVIYYVYSVNMATRLRPQYYQDPRNCSFVIFAINSYIRNTLLFFFI